MVSTLAVVDAGGTTAGGPRSPVEPPGSPRPPRSLRRVVAWMTLAVLAVMGVASLLRHLPSGSDLAGGQENVVRFLGRTVPFDFPPLGELVHATTLTLAMTVCGTFLAAALAVPLAWLAATPTTPHPGVRLVARALGVLARAVPDYVMAIALVMLFSVGTLPGAVALGLHSVGMLSRQFADTIEDLDPGPLSAVRAAGAGRAQQFVAGVVPRALPSWAASFLHRNDINLRQSVILGYAGVVGLGQDLAFALRALDYQRAAALTVVMFALCLVMEMVSGALRRRLVGQEARRVRRGRERRPAASLPATTGAGVPTRRSVAESMRRPWTADRIRTDLWLGAAVLTLLLALVLAEFRWIDLIEVWSRLPRFVAEALPPTFGQYSSGEMLGAMGETISIAFAATTLAVLLSVLVAPLAASNVAPGPRVRWLVRTVIVAVRSIPEIILAIVFIVMTGLGSQAGVLALGVAGLGLLGRFLADALEDLERGPQTAVEAAGGSRLQVLGAATVPLAIPATVGHVLYLLDHNLRAATLLGIVGGGGIGFYLNDAGRIGDYDVVAAILLMVLTTVVLVEAVSLVLRWALR